MYLRLCPKYTLGFLSGVLKNYLLYCFHDLFVVLAVKQMYLLLSVQLCKTIFPSCWHHTTLRSSAHYLLLPLLSQQNGFQDPFYFTDVLRYPQETSAPCSGFIWFQRRRWEAELSQEEKKRGRPQGGRMSCCGFSSLGKWGNPSIIGRSFKKVSCQWKGVGWREDFIYRERGRSQ